LVFNKRPRLVVAVSAPWSAILRQRSHTMRPHSHGQVFTAPHTRVITGGVLHPPCWPHTPPSTPMAPTGTCLQHAHALTAPRASPAVAPAAPCWHGRRRMRCGRQHSSVRCTAGAPMYDNPALYSNDDAVSLVPPPARAAYTQAGHDARPSQHAPRTKHTRPTHRRCRHQFSERLYWDKRYQQDPTTFECVCVCVSVGCISSSIARLGLNTSARG
jgi:hypothetical protein